VMVRGGKEALHGNGHSMTDTLLAMSEAKQDLRRPALPAAKPARPQRLLEARPTAARPGAARPGARPAAHR
jgi:hypothetical protein